MNSSMINKMNTELKKNWLVWTITIVVFFLFWFSLYENSKIFTAPREYEHTVAGQNYSDETIGEMTDKMIISQSFVAGSDQFSRIQIPFHTYSSNTQGTFELELREAGSGKVVFKQAINLSGLKDGKLVNFDFPKINSAKGKKYQIDISGIGLKSGTSATVWKSTTDHYRQGQLTIDGRSVKGDLRFKIVDVEIQPLVSKPIFVLASVVLLLLFVLSVLALRKYKNEMHKAFLVTALPIGLVLAIIIPPFDQLDEQEHYYRSFEVSEGLFLNQVTEHGLGNYIPVSLVDTVHDVQLISQKGYNYGIVKEAFGNKLNAKNRIFMRNYASSYPPTIYIPQALGLTLGRWIFDSPMMMLYLGRILNLLAYAAIVYTALKIVPFKKNLFYIMALLPMSIIQAASLSGDSTIISSAFLFVAYILYLAYGKVEKITLKHILTAIGIGIFIALAKSVYLPIVFLFLLIPLRKFKDKKDFIKKLLIVLAGCAIPFIIWNMLNFANMSIPDVRIHPGVSPKDQVKFVLTQPFHYLKVLVDSFLSLGESKFLGMLGLLGTFYHYEAPNIVIYTFLFLMLLFGLMNDETDLLVKWRRIDKPIMLSIMLAVLVLIYTALYVGYTPVAYSIVLGVQGRYFLPIAVFLFLSITNKQFINKSREINLLVYTIIHCSLYVLLLSYLYQING
ncbi:DUF2142 domain-containing protein [Neobacillus pocheonensis]|uniref:DUF2142 domain-containing protein n=1 Tax=Neobacillus pocheonensis TaxID=363869 RepID=A0ABT0WI31_9BACI|nr:DUF2142 domain-containing protein [Neobacillus pocheonensis]